ncbi:PEP-CTERM sorting domain-containing protein [Pelomonas sp. Root1237]|uniref:PEP-CTERM sorting domain-containing protein n=1 Tax=Pelomonas sp. Root1237 TaxID=1736434 RepID=UPI0006F5C129|nr:PEP-CTERM sorting domain-containing protein [Pelomonas sp. Root1237]KQV88970.1 hypothetical protein ASC91_09965 [Pelomonas sp. Root1237]
MGRGLSTGPEAAKLGGVEGFDSRQSPSDKLITNFNIDIGSALGTNDAFVGFTAATGSGYQNHDILNWRLASDTSITTDPGRLPEPADLALLSLAGVTALAASRRRRGG